MSNDIKDFMQKHGMQNESQFYRELIEIGFYVKKKQHESDEEILDLEALHREASEKIIILSNLIERTFINTWNAKNSSHESAYDEVSENKTVMLSKIESILNGEDGDIPNEEKARSEHGEDHRYL